MTTDLRDELHALADTQTFSSDPAVWDRGRRARRLDRAVRSAVVVALVAALVGTGALILRPDPVDPAGDVVEGGAIPRRISDIAPGTETESRLSVGRASVAFVSDGEPVVVTADDGFARRLNLAGWPSDDAIALALSPDGRTLAYRQDVDGANTWVGLLDLESGRTNQLIAHSGEDLWLHALTWSPDGAWLSWVGGSNPADDSRVGALRMSGERSHRQLLPYAVPDVAVDDDGTLYWSRDSGGIDRAPVGEPGRRTTTDDGVGAGAVSPDGSMLALRTAPGRGSRTLLVDEQRVVDHPFPDDTLDLAVTRPLGWVDDRLQLLLVQEGADGGELVVTTPEVDDSSTWRRSVGFVDAAPSGTISVAVDLVPDLDGTSSQELTHDFGAAAGHDRNPLAPTLVEVWLLVLLGAGLAVAVIALVVRSRRRLT